MATVELNLESLKAQILKLSVSDRVRLMDDIWDSIDSGILSPNLTASRQLELERRLADVQANPTDEQAWEEVKQELSRK